MPTVILSSRPEIQLRESPNQHRQSPLCIRSKRLKVLNWCSNYSNYFLKARWQTFGLWPTCWETLVSWTVQPPSNSLLPAFCHPLRSSSAWSRARSPMSQCDSGPRALERGRTRPRSPSPALRCVCVCGCVHSKELSPFTSTQADILFSTRHLSPTESFKFYIWLCYKSRLQHMLFCYDTCVYTPDRITTVVHCSELLVEYIACFSLWLY